jgi:hypothetical protein
MAGPMADLSEFNVYVVSPEDVLLIHRMCGCTVGENLSVNGDSLSDLVEKANTHNCPR